jgi:hypothetical protein
VVLVIVDRSKYIQAANEVNRFRIKEREAIKHEDRKFPGSFFFNAEDVVDDSLEKPFLVPVGESRPPVRTEGGLSFCC